MAGQDANKSFFTSFPIPEFCNNAVTDYQKNHDINEEMRNNKCNVHQVSKLKETAFEFRAPTKRNIALFRGIEGLYNILSDGFKTGVFMDKGFSSTSFDIDSAASFVNKDNRDEKCCLFHIHIPANNTFNAIPIYKISQANYEKENEVLLPPGSTFQVIRDPQILESIKKTWGYQDGDSSCEDWYANTECHKVFPYPTFKYKCKYKCNYNDIHVIPVTLSQLGGGGLSKKFIASDIKKHVLGRERKIYLLGRRQYVKYKGVFVPLSTARKIDGKVRGI